jgi:CRISPR/Cas system-associated protein endoribonuclease Cas2
MGLIFQGFKIPYDTGKETTFINYILNLEVYTKIQFNSTALNHQFASMTNHLPPSPISTIYRITEVMK